MTQAQHFIRSDLDDRGRVARLRIVAVNEEERPYSTVWTLADGSRIERGCARGVAAYGTLPILETLIERFLKADRQTVTYYRGCERSARRAYGATGAEHWRAAADEWIMARFRLETEIRAHLRERSASAEARAPTASTAPTAACTGPRPETHRPIPTSFRGETLGAWGHSVPMPPLSCRGWPPGA